MEGTFITDITPIATAFISVLVALTGVVAVHRRSMRKLQAGIDAGVKKQLADMTAEAQKQVASREQQLTDRVQASADDWRDRYFQLDGRHEELLELLGIERARAARMEGQLRQMAESLDELSHATGDFFTAKSKE